MKFSHVIFDLDGTLADTARDIANAANHVRTLYHLPALSVADVSAYVGDGARRLVERVLPGLAPDSCESALAAFLSYYAAHPLDTTRLYPGIDGLLRRLGEAGVGCSVLSNKPVALCRAIVAGLGVASCFAEVVGGDSLPARKPDPAGVVYLMERLRLERDAILLVGDSPVDRETAHAAGVAFCGVGWGLGSAALAASGEGYVAPAATEVMNVVTGVRPVT